MVRASDFILNSLQVSIFTPERARIRTSMAMGAILSRFAERYAGAPLSFPEEMPEDVPSALLRSDPECWQISIHKNRIDSHWRLPLDAWGHTPVPFTESVYSDVAEPLIHLLESALLEGWRLFLIASVQYHYPITRLRSW